MTKKQGINYCPRCGTFLNYDGDMFEWYCNDCDYTETERAWEFKNKYRGLEDE